MLIEAGVLDEARLRSALADQRRWGRSLGRTLVEMKLIAEDELVRVLARQLGMPAVDLDKRVIPDAVCSQIPDELARHHQIIAFDQQMKFLDVAMVDPTNLGVIDELRIRTQLNIRSYLAGPRQMERALAKYHGGTQRNETEISFDGGDVLDVVTPQVERSMTNELPRTPTRDGLRQYPRTVPPNFGLTGAPLRDAEIDALQNRISTLEALVERDEAVLRKLLALLIDKGVATRDEIMERLA
ncbi:MAG: hypothetical protein H0T46_10200 [Deltaproteobacteria bacterium]|nr:hypothetical protein [Deltaproteobacteria bacterium]